mgnify:CR=1 FL=1
MEKFPLTKEGFEQLEVRLKHLKSVERPAIIQQIAEAREHGDLSENAEYHSAREKQGFIEGEIANLEGTISRAEVFDVAMLSGSSVVFGATVGLVDEETEEEVTYQIVGDLEADLKAGKISVSSPLALALIGKEVGASAEVNTPKGTRYYEIEKISFV